MSVEELNEEVNEEVEEVEAEATAADLLPFDLASQDPVTKAITEQVLVGLDKINEANALLSSDSKKKDSEVDKGLSEYKGENEEMVSLIAERASAEAALKLIVDKVRNLFRVEVLGEEEVTTPTVNIEEVKASRKVILDLLTSLKGFATINKNEDVLHWIETLPIPQVDRQAVTILGQKKARVLVTIGDTTYQSFGEAAKGISTDDNLVTSTDLNQAWAESGEAKTFEFQGQTVKVQAKETKKEKEEREAKEAAAAASSGEGSESSEDAIFEVETD